ncbi:MAG TPA: caspase family protein [Thermoanaerobaculia bacterium]|jgi:hypothetical protein|nr:caspase family protein [Thermoanaerobaculia bacterium]
MVKPYGRSLHIGVNNVSDHYDFSLGSLKGAENDAKFMADLALQRQFSDVRCLIGPQATARAVIDDILDAAATLPAGSLFLLTFAGHGIEILNDNFSIDDRERCDQAWCTYDRALLDDELKVILPEFGTGTRVVVVVDACHSATPIQNLYERIARARTSDCSDEQETILNKLEHALGEIAHTFQSRSSVIGELRRRERFLGFEASLLTSERHKELYRSIRDALVHAPRKKLSASVVSLGACRDDEATPDGEPHGDFTAAIKTVWKDGTFAGTHEDLWKEVRKLAALYGADPSWCCRKTVSSTFWNEPAFTI